MCGSKPASACSPSAAAQTPRIESRPALRPPRRCPRRQRRVPCPPVRTVLPHLPLPTPCWIRWAPKGSNPPTPGLPDTPDGGAPLYAGLNHWAKRGALERVTAELQLSQMESLKPQARLRQRGHQAARGWRRGGATPGATSGWAGVRAAAGRPSCLHQPLTSAPASAPGALACPCRRSVLVPRAAAPARRPARAAC